jgi:hypothetical protein
VLGSILLCIVSVGFVWHWDGAVSGQSLVPIIGDNFGVEQSSSQVQRLGDIEYTTLDLDGIPLFQIADRSGVVSEQSGPLPVERRLRTIQRTLNDLITTGFDTSKFRVCVADLNDQTVLVANDRQYVVRRLILTVTEQDSQIAHQPIPSLAKEWADILQSRLIESVVRRQPEARKRQTIQAGAIARYINASNTSTHIAARRLVRTTIVEPLLLS